MPKKFLMGNEAIGLGAIRAGVDLVAGYPGTPSTEVLQTVAENRSEDIYVEWSVNEKAAMEVAAAASYAGARSMVTMKQVGLNVASDPLMSLAYVGVKGGMVIVIADDPGPISSQTEQDTRHFGQFAKLPVFDPASPAEAYEMIGEAFDYSEKYKTPVLLRPTTRVCHGVGTVEISEPVKRQKPEGFIKDSGKWVIFPKLSNINHKMIEERNPVIGEDFCSYNKNFTLGNGSRGIITHGINYAYTMEALEQLTDWKDEVRVLKIGTPNPLPEAMVREFLESVNEVLAIEELDPVLEKACLEVCGKYKLPNPVFGKLTGHVQAAGENSVESVMTTISSFMQTKKQESDISASTQDAPNLPIRPPVLCAGCSHRASFYAVKKAVDEMGAEGVYTGDIGCYTLGNAKPLDMVDTCLCMGAGITMAQGMYRIEPDKKYFAFVGDSTFFASGITGVVNAVYNRANMTVVILDNSTTAMTGHQPHPGTGKTVTGEVAGKVDIVKVLEGVGVKKVMVVNPMNHREAVEAVKELDAIEGVKAIVFKYPCVATFKAERKCCVERDNCRACKVCINEIGCPATVIDEETGKVKIEGSLCTGCGLCAQICPFNAITC